MKLNTFQFKQTPVAIAMDAVANDVADSVTTFAWHDVFYAGEHIDMHGKKNAFTREDLEQIVANFSANTTPLVIGHPDTNAPAYGWVSAVRVTDDNRLEIQADNVNVEFAKAVAAKAFPNRSVKIFKGKNGWEFAHIGYLGAAKPALEGMPWQFTSHDSDVVYQYALPDHAASIITRFMSNVREWAIEKWNLADADRLIPAWEIEEMRNALAAETTKDHLTPVYSQPQETDVDKFTQEQLDAAVNKAVEDASASFSKQIADIQADADAAKAKLAAAEADKEKAAFAAAVATAQATIDELVAKGALVPAQTDGLAQFMANLPSAAESEFAFSQGDKEVKETPFAFASRFLSSLGKTKSPLGDEPELDTIDNSDLDARATAYAKEHKCSYATAVTAVSNA